MTTAACTYVYRLNAADEITFVSADWLKFAQENDASQLNEAGVLGSSLWNHVTGDATCRLYRALFQNLRIQRQEIAIPFNCDSPTVVRHMTLTLRGLGGGAIELEGRINLVRQRAPVLLFNRRSSYSDTTVPICSLCRKLEVDNGWVSAEEAVVRYRWLASAPAPKLDETLCPTCQGYSV